MGFLERCREDVEAKNMQQRFLVHPERIPGEWFRAIKSFCDAMEASLGNMRIEIDQIVANVNAANANAAI
jgi:hypothetical protein